MISNETHSTNEKCVSDQKILFRNKIMIFFASVNSVDMYDSIYSTCVSRERAALQGSRRLVRRRRGTSRRYSNPESRILRDSMTG